MKTKVMNFVNSVRFRNRGEAYAFLDAVQKEMESTGKDVSLLHLCTYLTIGKLPDDISVEDCKKYVWTNADFNDALVFTGGKDWFSSYGILLPECKEADLMKLKYCIRLSRISPKGIFLLRIIFCSLYGT